MCACHINHSVGCIEERIKLPVRKVDGIYVNLDTRQTMIPLILLMQHRMYIINSHHNSCTLCVPMLSFERPFSH